MGAACHGHALPQGHGHAGERQPLSMSCGCDVDDDIVRVATIGDTVTIHFVCRAEDGQVRDGAASHTGS
jgi:hypothetical protein